MKSKLLSFIFKYHKSNRHESNIDYPQSWWIVNRLPLKVQMIIQYICGKLGGHELSNTEWGYGGGNCADRWCRWCNKLIRVEKTSVWFQYKESKNLMELVKRSE